MAKRKQRIEAAPADRLPRETLYWLIAAQTLAMIPLFAYLPLWVSFCAVATLLVRFSLAALDKPLPSKWIIIAAAIAAAVFVFTSYGTLAGRDAGVALLTLMLGLKILEVRSRRDAIVSTFMIYFLLLTGFFFSQSIPVALFMCPAVVIITACLVQINQGSQRIPTGEKLGFATRMLAQSIPFMVIMFVLFPRLSGPLWTLGDESSSAVSGLSDEMSPGNISKLILSDAIAFRVSFKNQPPQASERYWRGPVFWLYDGRTWRPRKFSRYLNELETGGKENLIEYTVTLEPHDNHWLFALDTPVSAPREATINSDHQLLSIQPVKQRKTYSTASSTTLESNARLSRFENRMALDLPDGAAPRARELAEQWRATLPDTAAVIERALTFFSEQEFSYTLNPPILGAAPVDEFLFNTRQGFCEHYAGSFVVLMRAAGIPARVVTGYLGGEWNPLGEYLLVRQADAHAWAEVWLPGKGWLRVDPTAAVSPDRVESGIDSMISGSDAAPLFARVRRSLFLLNRISMVWDTMNFRWNEWVVSFDPAKQLSLMRKLGFANSTWRTLVIAMFVCLAFVAGAYAAAALWRRSGAMEPEVKTYQKFCARLAKLGIERRAHEGPSDYAARVIHANPRLSEPVTQITKLYTGLRYGKLTRRDNLGRLRKLVRALPA